VREIIFAAVLGIACGCIVYGIALLHEPTAWIVGGILGAVWSWLVLTEVGE
jgi:hypothetical protein